MADRNHRQAATAAERSQLYRLLATVFRAEPGPELLALVGTAAFAELAAGFGVPDGTGAMGQETLEDLATEYTRLFLGPGPRIAPYECVQRGAETPWGPESGEVSRMLGEAGFDIDPAWHDLPDHISVELEFVAHLTSVEAEAWTRGDTASALRARQWQDAFLSRHLGLWTGVFCARVGTEARLPFYRAFAAILGAFVADEREVVAAHPMPIPR